MKVHFTLTVAALAAVLLAFAGLAGAQSVTSSKHDLSTYANVTLPAGFFVCQSCHAPHPAVTGTPLANTPLANRDYAGAAYTTYSSSTLDTGSGGPPPAAPSPTGVDLLCLSCHDGSVAVDIFGENTDSTAFGGATRAGSGVLIGSLTGAVGNGLVGTDLSTSHPVSITYNSAYIAQTPTEFRAVDAAGNVTNGATTSPLFGGQVKCASCHNPHNGTAGEYFLRATAANLCITCHLK